MDIDKVDCTKQLETLTLKRKLQFLLVSCIASDMMPIAPTAGLPKPKIGFSIDSIVGGARNFDHKGATKSISNRSHSTISADHSQISASPSPEPSFTDISEKSPTPLRGPSSSFARLQNHLHHQFNTSPPLRPIPIQTHHPLHHVVPLGSNSSSGNSSPGVLSPPSNPNPHSSTNSAQKINSSGKCNDPSSPPVTTSDNASRSPSPQTSSSEATNTLGVTLPLVSHHPGGLHGAPLQPHGMSQFAGYPPGVLNFAAMAAAAAAHNYHPTPHPGISPGWLPSGHVAPHHPHHPAAWLLAKHSRLFPHHRFGPGPDLPGFLLQPFRKPKRIRTAFSPSQLLKLEHAFERNHYVVGAERKQLANSLSLSETQVKVWFQNRRTKHKRCMQEEEISVKKPGGSSGSNLSTSADSSTRNYSEEMSDDEEILLEEDYSDQDAEMEHLNLLNSNP